jgi:hypothetical protein
MEWANVAASGSAVRICFTRRANWSLRPILQ